MKKESQVKVVKHCFQLTLTLTLTLSNLLRVQNNISNWRRKQDDVPIDIQPQ